MPTDINGGGELSHDQLYYTLSVLELCFWVVCLGLIMGRHSVLLARYIYFFPALRSQLTHITIPAIYIYKKNTPPPKKKYSQN